MGRIDRNPLAARKCILGSINLTIILKQNEHVGKGSSMRHNPRSIITTIEFSREGTFKSQVPLFEGQFLETIEFPFPVSPLCPPT